MFLLQPVLDFVHLVRTTVFYIWSISVHLGKGTFLLLKNFFHFLQDIGKAIIILGEELLRFLTELSQSIDAVTSTISIKINVAIDAICCFGLDMRKFFSLSELQARLVASKVAIGIKNFGALLYGALILIADTLVWLVTLVPRAIINFVIAIFDFIIFFIAAIGKAVLYTLQTLINDIFRLSISIFVLILLWKKRRSVRYLLLRTSYKIRMLLQTRMRVIITRWRNYNRPRFGNLTAMPMRRSALRQSRQSDQSNGVQKHQFQPICVICRENPKNVLLWPCRHMCMCEDCAEIITENDTQRTSCPLCRSEVEFVVPIYT